MDRAEPRNANLVLLWCCQCVATLGLMAMVPVMPLYLARLGEGYSPVWASLALAAPAVTALIFASRIGRACDRYGYRAMVLASLAVFTVSMTLMALSDGIGGFLLGRLLLGAAGVGVTLTAFACAAARAGHRGRVLGRLQSASACGCLAGPVIGGLLMDAWSLRPLLIATAAFSGLAALLAASMLREPVRKEAPAREEMPGAQQQTSPLRNPFLLYWMLAACLSQAAAFALVNVFVLFLEPRMPGESLAGATGMIHAAAWAAGMLAAPWWGRGNDAGDVRRWFFLAAAGCAVSVGLLPLAGELWQILLLRVLQGACFTALAQSVYFALSRVRSAGRQGEGAGFAKRYLVSGQVVGPLLVAALLPWLEPAAVLWCVAALFAAAACCALKAPGIHAMEARTAGLGFIKP